MRQAVAGLAVALAVVTLTGCGAARPSKYYKLEVPAAPVASQVGTLRRAVRSATIASNSTPAVPIRMRSEIVMKLVTRSPLNVMKSIPLASSHTPRYPNSPTLAPSSVRRSRRITAIITAAPPIAAVSTRPVERLTAIPIQIPTPITATTTSVRCQCSMPLCGCGLALARLFKTPGHVNDIIHV